MQLSEIFNIARILTWFNFSLGQVVGLLYFFFSIAIQIYIGSGLDFLPWRCMKLWIPTSEKWEIVYIYITIGFHSDITSSIT